MEFSTFTDAISRLSIISVVFVCNQEWSNNSGIPTINPNAVVFIATEILEESKSALSAGFASEIAVNASMRPITVPLSRIIESAGALDDATASFSQLQQHLHRFRLNVDGLTGMGHQSGHGFDAPIFQIEAVLEIHACLCADRAAHATQTSSRTQ